MAHRYDDPLLIGERLDDLRGAFSLRCHCDDRNAKVLPQLCRSVGLLHGFHPPHRISNVLHWVSTGLGRCKERSLQVQAQNVGATTIIAPRTPPPPLFTAQR